MKIETEAAPPRGGKKALELTMIFPKGLSGKNPTWVPSDILNINICFKMSKSKKQKSLTEKIFDTKDTNPSNTEDIPEE